METAERLINSRELPRQIDYYRIGQDGSVTTCNSVIADVYISEFDVKYFSDKEIMLHVLTNYGPVVGVMHDVTCNIQSRGYKTPKMLLGVIKRPKKS